MRSPRVRGVMTLVLSLMMTACSPSEPDGSSADVSMHETNPFFSESILLYQLPPFDRIDDAHYLPAFERGMAEQLEEVDVIAHATESPTFENTLVALERSGQLLNRVATTFFNLTGADTNDTMDDIRTEIAPKLAAHTDQILLNDALFARVRTLYEQREAADPRLDAESRRLIERYHTDFVRAGAELSKSDKERMQAINAELATQQTAFSQNVLSEVNESAVVVDTREELAGLSDSQVASAAEAATARDSTSGQLSPASTSASTPASDASGSRPGPQAAARRTMRDSGTATGRRQSTAMTAR